MKKSISVLVLSGMIFGCVGAVDRKDTSTSAWEEDFVLRAQNDLDDSDEGIQEPKTTFEKAKDFLWQYRYEIAIGTGVVVSAICLKKYLDYRNRNKLKKAFRTIMGSDIAGTVVDEMSNDDVKAGLKQVKMAGAVMRAGERMAQRDKESSEEFFRKSREDFDEARKEALGLS